MRMLAGCVELCWPGCAGVGKHKYLMHEGLCVV